MPTSTARRKAPRPRVNIPLAIGVPEYQIIARAVELTGESRNGFIREASLNRAVAILEAHGETDLQNIAGYVDDEPAHPAA